MAEPPSERIAEPEVAVGVDAHENVRADEWNPNGTALTIYFWNEGPDDDPGAWGWDDWPPDPPEPG
jgi:hypothetical protein